MVAGALGLTPTGGNGMAGVQELIAAQEAEKSPLIKLLEGGANGYLQGQNHFYDNALKLVQAQQMRQEQEQQAQMQREIQQRFAAEKEAETKQGFNAVAGTPKATFPTQKLKEKITQNEKGKYSRSYEYADPKDSMGIPANVMPYVQKGDLEGLSRIYGDAVPIEVARLATANRAQTGVADRFETNTGMRVKEGKTRSADKLRDDFATQSKSFNDYTEAYQRISSTAEDPSPAGDLALIYNFAKMMDERGAVREQDFTQVAKTGALGDQIKSLVLKNATGERLPENVRKDLVDRARRIYEGQKLIQDEKRTFYSGLAEDAGIDPKKVTPDFTPKGKTGGVAPAVDEKVIKGKTYKRVNGKWFLQ